MVYNALVAVAIGLELGMTIESIKEGIKNIMLQNENEYLQNKKRKLHY